MGGPYIYDISRLRVKLLRDKQVTVKESGGDLRHSFYLHSTCI